MLIKRITNPWMKWRLTGECPKEAFLYVISTYNAMDSDKVGMLITILKKHPETLGDITVDELYQAFCALMKLSKKKGELLSYTEMGWVSLCTGERPLLAQIERDIYRGFLEASDHWDKARREFAWTIFDSEKTEVAKQLLESDKIGSKRKMQIAQEFGLPWTCYARDYYRRLLWDSHYDKAMELWAVCTDEDAIEVIMKNLNTGHHSDAVDICIRFLPHRRDVYVELQKIKEVLDGIA